MAKTSDISEPDHKGRAQPIYSPRPPRPKSWRPGKGVRLLLGLVPGVRLLVTEDSRKGLPYFVLGILTMIGVILVGADIPAIQDNLERLRLQERWILVPAAILFSLICSYEVLRLASSLEERSRSPWAPRIAATPLFPALIFLFEGPGLVTHWPTLVEAGWFAAAVLFIGSLPAVAWCGLERFFAARAKRRQIVLGFALTILAILVILVLIVWQRPQWLAAPGRYFQALDYVAIPKLLPL